jgi:hypothetical protein
MAARIAALADKHQLPPRPARPAAPLVVQTGTKVMAITSRLPRLFLKAPTRLEESPTTVARDVEPRVDVRCGLHVWLPEKVGQRQRDPSMHDVHAIGGFGCVGGPTCSKPYCFADAPLDQGGQRPREQCPTCGQGALVARYSYRNRLGPLTMPRRRRGTGGGLLTRVPGFDSVGRMMSGSDQGQVGRCAP